MLEELEAGETLFAEGKVEEALSVFESLLQKDPSNNVALNNKGVVLNQLRRFKEANDAFTKAIENDKSNCDAIFNLISNCISTRDWSTATHKLRKYGHYLSSKDRNSLKNCLDGVSSTARLPSADSSIRTVTLVVPITDIPSITLRLDLEQFSQRTMWNSLSRGKLYEPETSRFLMAALEKGDCFIDIGAHIGYFSLLAASLVGPSGKILAIEPEEFNYRNLKANIQLNDFSTIQHLNKALGSDKHQGQFFVNSDNDGGHALWDVGLHPFNVKSEINKVVKTVEVATLDSILEGEKLRERTVIKIDTEGSEFHILKGSMETITRFQVPYIICEINRFGLQQMGTNENELRSLMEGLKYNTHLLILENDVRLIGISGNQYVQSQYVFNLVFVRE